MNRPIDKPPLRRGPRRRRDTAPSMPADAALGAAAGAERADTPDAAPPAPGERLGVEQGAAAPPRSIEAMPADAPEAGLAAFGGREGAG